MRITAFLSLATLLGATLPASAASFTMTSTSVTLNSSGNGSSTVTVAAASGYSGQVSLRCIFQSGPAPESKAPICALTGLTPNAVTLSATVPKALETIPFVPTGSAIPGVVARLSPTHPLAPFAPSPLPAGAAALAGLFFLGSARIRRMRGKILLAALASLSLAALTGCGGSGKTAGMTPGTYTYLVTGTDANSHSASTTISVTVPAN